MAEAFLSLPDSDRKEALLLAAEKTGRPAFLLEKDVWVVWTLNALFEGPLGEHLVFKGGTSLSKAYGGIIKRFSEDIDLTYDIHQLIPDLLGGETAQAEPIPPSRSQADKWSDAVQKRLPDWIAQSVTPVLQAALQKDGLTATLAQVGDENEKLELRYDAVTDGQSYVAEAVLLEFGARSSGEPANVRTVECDAAGAQLDLSFPIANPRVMAAERTFWEKATAAHVYCLQGVLRPRYARHWYDVVQLNGAGIAASAIAQRSLGVQVAQHKQSFFRVKAADGSWIDYEQAISGSLRLVPDGEARQHLEDDYRQMIEGRLIEDESPMSFEDLMRGCEEIERMANAALAAPSSAHQA